MRKSLRYLRITWTVVCGLAFMLLCALWVRSYWWQDIVSRTIKDKVGTVSGSASGVVYFSRMDFRALQITYPKTQGWTREVREPPHVFDKKLRWIASLGDFEVRIPHWLLILPIALVAVAPWIRWRFTTRTLLIAITLVAVVLGLIVWLR
jgi:hypothetical protein